MINAIINHLWQSTLFAPLVALLALAFRRNRAQVRYGLWFSASLKFLVPFSLLLTLGGYWARPPAAHHTATPAMAVTVEEFVEPFTPAPAPPLTVPLPPRAMHVDLLPWAALGLWVCGFAGIVLLRWRAWLRIRAAVRSSVPLDIPCAVEVRSSSARIEPGVIGFVHPILLLPAGIEQRLAPGQLQAVLKHELCHVQRRDNLTAAIHMLVEAVFWFHPLVWWLGARLVEERECACDEAVLESGGDPHSYAESILKTCQFCAESPLACVSGVASANIRKRMVRIMNHRFAHNLSLGKKLLLMAVSVAVIAGPVLLGRANSFQGREWLRPMKILGRPFVSTDALPQPAPLSGPWQHRDMPSRAGRLKIPAITVQNENASGETGTASSGSTIRDAYGGFASMSDSGAPDSNKYISGIFPISIRTLPNAPFTATVRTELIRKLENGDAMVHKNHRLVARDGSGRVFEERRWATVDDDEHQSSLMRTDFRDPISHQLYVCNASAQVCRLFFFAPPPADAGTASSDPTHQVTRINIGTATISGLETMGTRELTVIPASEEGTDRPVTLSKELWYSPQLGVNIKVKRFDPRFGTENFLVDDVVLGEPDPNVFKIPAGATVVQEVSPAPNVQ